MPTPYSIKADFNVPIQMRDGATTYADIFRPDAPGEQFPVLLTRTPFDKSSPQNRTGTLDVVRAAMSGYAAVVQDVRGALHFRRRVLHLHQRDQRRLRLHRVARLTALVHRQGRHIRHLLRRRNSVARCQVQATLADSYRARLHRARLP